MMTIEVLNAYAAAFILGISYSFTLCSSTCLPYITSYIASIGAGFRRGILVTAIYNSGRIAAYTLIGILAILFKALIREELLLPYQQCASIVFGAATILVGLSLLFRRRKPPCNCEGFHKGVFDIHVFVLGFSKGLVICPPLLGLLLYSVASPGLIEPLVLVLLFGIGTTPSPLLIIAGITGWLFNKAPLLSHWISMAGTIILIILGLNAIIGAVIVL